MTALEKLLGEIEEKAKAATPGPWKCVEGDYVGFVGQSFFNVVQEFDDGDMICPGRVQLENAQHIAQCSPDRILSLVSSCRLLLAQNGIYREALDTEKLEGEMGANENQGGRFNDGATQILRRWISTNSNALAQADALTSEKEKSE